MIVELSVEDLAIIRRVDVEFGGGFTALTGETGAGKSLLVDALELALGERADSELVRAGAVKASVGLTVDLSARPDLVAALAQDGVEAEEGRIFLARTVSADGRSTVRINGRQAPVGTLREIGRRLVDLHGQHQHQSLIHPETHLGYLDDWIGRTATEVRAEVGERFVQAQQLRSERRALERGVAEREHRLDLLSFQFKEIDAAAPRVGEYAEIDSEVLRLKNAEHLIEAVTAALRAASDGEGAALDALRSASKTLDGALKFDDGLADPANQVREALYGVQDAVETLRGYLEALDADPRTLDSLQDRLAELKRLRRKYGPDEAAILAFAENARADHARLEDADANLGRIEAELRAAEGALTTSTARLTGIRREKAGAFAEAVEVQLKELSLPNARLAVSIVPQAPDPSGADAIEFLFSANAGEGPRPLAKIASGGELSRVMLGLKIALAGRAGVPTLIFDEVDSGLGGRAAATMGRKLRELGASNQVLVISHLPQVAAQADSHFRIEKAEIDGRTASSLVPLSAEQREDEIARMLSGETITETARASAREMLRR